jgi:hypothetical protein
MILFSRDAEVRSRRGRIGKCVSHIEELTPFNGTKMHSRISTGRVTSEGRGERSLPIAGRLDDRWSGGAELGLPSLSPTLRRPDLSPFVTPTFPLAPPEAASRRPRGDPSEETMKFPHHTPESCETTCRGDLLLAPHSCTVSTREVGE